MSPNVSSYILNLQATERPIDPLISCVVPAYNEAANIVRILETLHQLLNAEGYRHELIVVDDGSRDDTVEKVLTQAKGLPVKLVQLSRNFGKEIALTAGLDFVKGDAAVLIDADFQHPPEYIPEFLQHWREGYDMVYSVRGCRKDESLAKRCFTKVFYTLLNSGVRIKIPKDSQDFRVLDRRMIEALRAMPERLRFMKGLYNWPGFAQLAVVTHTAERLEGKSSFNFLRLLNLALTGLTSFSVMPLRLTTIIGALISTSSVLYAMYILIKTLILGESQQGWPTLAIAVFFLGGMQIMFVGILGEYIGRVYEEVKGRPTYFVNRTVSLDRQENHD